VSDTPRTDAATRMAFSGEYMVPIQDAQKLERELADMRESELRFSKCFERIARAVGITSPLVLMAMAESDEENYAEILARHIENRESKKAKEVSHE